MDPVVRERDYRKWRKSTIDWVDDDLDEGLPEAAASARPRRRLSASAPAVAAASASTPCRRPARRRSEPGEPARWGPWRGGAARPTPTPSRGASTRTCP